MNKPLLTIAIPTYNRAALLKHCLESIVTQLDETTGADVEVIVSDNASADNTPDIVKPFTNSGYAINYIRQQTNIGPDPNFGYCFLTAKGKYVWICSDDDFILPGYLPFIINLLKNNDLGCVHLNRLWYNGTYNHVTAIPQKIDYDIYPDALQFTERVNYWFTFISSNIVNKEALTDTAIVPEFYNTNLVQFSWTIPPVFSGRPNAVVNNQVLACKGGNTGGYALFTVFGKKLNKNLDSLIAKGLADKAAKDIINRHLLQSFFPEYMYGLGKNYKSEDPIKVLMPLYWDSALFWRKIFIPVIKRRYLTLAPFNRAIAKAAYSINNSGYYRQLVNQKQAADDASHKFKFWGENARLPRQRSIINAQYISIGSNFNSQDNLRLEAIDEHEVQQFNPELIIGDNVTVSADVQISCINKIVIGNNVVLGSRVYICDYTHGDNSAETLSLPVIRRPLVTKGPVIIEDNVLIGAGACILGGVTLGKNTIIGPNAVVTQSLPANSSINATPQKAI